VGRKRVRAYVGTRGEEDGEGREIIIAGLTVSKTNADEHSGKKFNATHTVSGPLVHVGQRLVSHALRRHRRSYSKQILHP